ncbi:MAG: hypothetical protein SFU98_11730 [Leptospiraceae bacterium]|nr:hypothetical protein [Leptospiraceae bacterium]
MYRDQKAQLENKKQANELMKQYVENRTNWDKAANSLPIEIKKIQTATEKEIAKAQKAIDDRKKSLETQLENKILNDRANEIYQMHVKEGGLLSNHSKESAAEKSATIKKLIELLKAEKIVEGRDLNGGFNQILHSLNPSLITTNVIKTDVKDTFTVMQDEAGRVVVRDKVVVPAYNSPAPMGGQTITLSRGIEIKRYNLDDPIVDEMVDLQNRNKKDTDLVPKKGTNQDVTYFIPTTGNITIDGKEVQIWNHYQPTVIVDGQEKVYDSVERFTTREGAEMFVNSALAFRQAQLDAGITNPQPMKTNDFDTAGFGDSRTQSNGHPHHNKYVAIDIGLPGSDGNRASTHESANYDRDKTIKLIESFAKNVPKGKTMVVYFNDEEVIKALNGKLDNNGKPISVGKLGGHDGHVHVGLQ